MVKKQAKRFRLQVLITASILFCTADPALADPCKAISDKGPLPPYLAKGKAFSGPVVYVADGDGMCVDVGRRGNPAQWVEVRIADFYAPELREPGGAEAKAALERVAMGKPAVCTSQKKSWDRVVAFCRIGGVSIGQRLSSAGGRQGGNAWKSGR